MRRFKRQSANRGTAMLEFTVVLPLLALLIAGIFFLGWVERSEQRLLTAARYGAWRNNANTEAVADALKQAWILYGEPDQQEQRDAFVDEYQQQNQIVVTAPLLNERFYDQKGENISFVADSGPDDVIERCVADAFAQNIDAGDLAEKSILDSFPRGYGFKTSASFEHNYDAWYKFTKGDTMMSRRQYRDGVPWRRFQTSYLDPVRELFLYDLDGYMYTVQPAYLQGNLRNLYLQEW